MENNNEQLKFDNTQVESKEELQGVIKPKKKLEENVEIVVTFLTDYYNIYIFQNKLKPIKNVKEEIEIIKNNELYHPAFICLLLILRLVNTENASEQASILKGIFDMYVSQGFENYTAVTNMLAMFKLVFDKKNNVQLDMQDEDKIILDIPIPDENENITE